MHGYQGFAMTPQEQSSIKAAMRRVSDVHGCNINQLFVRDLVRKRRRPQTTTHYPQRAKDGLDP
jgi:hypothetical protein